MIHNKVDFQEFSNWFYDTSVTYASSSRERKKLVAYLNGKIIVTINDEVFWAGTQLFSAVEAYNSITKKFEK